VCTQTSTRSTALHVPLSPSFFCDEIGENLAAEAATVVAEEGEEEEEEETMY
jgi:hypothetical protein